MENERKLRVVITVDGQTRHFHGTYHQLHPNEWNGIIRLMLDDAYEIDEKLAKF